MYTACPNCKTRFRVSAAQLKAAQGQVQCGKCHEVFDAFWALEGNNSDPQAEPPTRPNLDPVSATAAPPPELDTIIRAGSPRKSSKKKQEVEAEPMTQPPSMSPLTDYPLADAPSVQAGPRKAKLPPIDDLFGDIRHLPDDKARISGDTTTPEPQGEVEFAIPAAIHAEDLPQAPKAAPKRPTHSALWALGITLMSMLL